MVKNPPANARDAGDLIPGSARSPGGGHDNHSSILAWGIHGQRGCRVAKSQTRLKQLSTHVLMGFF